MTAVAPIPQPEPDPAPDRDDGWVLLDSLRRRLDDQASQTRRTQDQVSQLAESIAALVAIQRRRSRWLNLNSFVAYVIFTMLLGGGFLFLYHSRADELVESREAAVGERDLAVRRADEAATKASARDKADAKAWEVYQLLEQGKRGEASSKLAALRDLPLSRTERAVVGERALQSQAMEVDAAIKAAVAAVKAGRFVDVIAPLEAALKTEPATTTRAAQMHYYLGVSYAKGSATPAELDKAATHLQAAVNADVDQEDARFQLASILDRNGAYAKARTEYDKFATAHPQSQLAVFAMRRSATLARMPPSAPITPPKAVAPPVTPAPAVAPTTPAAPNAAPPPPKVVPLPPPPPKVVPPPSPATAPVVTPPAAPASQLPNATPGTTPPGAAPPSPFSTNLSTTAAPMAVLDGPPTPAIPGPDRRTRRLRPKSPASPTPPPPSKPEPTDPETPAPPPEPLPPKPEPAPHADLVDSLLPLADRVVDSLPPLASPSGHDDPPTKPTPPIKPRDGVTDGPPRPALPVSPRDGITDKPMQPALPIVPRDGIADEPSPPSPTPPSAPPPAPAVAR